MTNTMYTWTAAIVLLLRCFLAIPAKPDRYFYRTAQVGQTVKFPCETDLAEDVNWKRMDVFGYIYVRGSIAPGLAPRITVDRSGSNTLTIRNVSAEESTKYACIEDGGHGRKHFYRLTVTDVVGYSHLAVTGGQSAELPCNTSLTSDMMWTYDIDDGYVDYVFWNGHTAADKPRLSVTATAGGCHSLVISNAQLNDSGLYDCYDGNGTRKAGYRLIIDFAETETVTEDEDIGTPAAILIGLLAVIIVLILLLIVASVLRFRAGYRQVAAAQELAMNVLEPSNHDVSRPDRKRVQYRRSVLLEGYVSGMTVLENVVYLVCERSATILMYSADTLSPLGEGIHVEAMRNPTDVVACRRQRQLYVADWQLSSMTTGSGHQLTLWRVSADDQSSVKWLNCESTTVRPYPCTLSLNACRLLVTSSRSRRLRQYRTTDRQLLCAVVVNYVELLYHGVETTRGTFIVAHRGTLDDDLLYALSEVDNQGAVLSSFTGVDLPHHLSSDSEGRVLVADLGNHRILLTNIRLQVQCVVLDVNSQIKMWRPRQLYHDEVTSQLHVLHYSSGWPLCDVVSLFTLV